MNSDDRLKNKLRFRKPTKKKIKRPTYGSEKIECAKPLDVYDSPVPNIILGDMLGTGIIGGIDLDITTPI